MRLLGGALPLELGQAVHDVGSVNQADLGFSASGSGSAGRKTHRPFLIRGDVHDAIAVLEFVRVAAPDTGGRVGGFASAHGW